jgi:hypothetical protein
MASAALLMGFLFTNFCDAVRINAVDFSISSVK